MRNFVIVLVSLLSVNGLMAQSYSVDLGANSSSPNLVALAIMPTLVQDIEEASGTPKVSETSAGINYKELTQIINEADLAFFPNPANGYTVSSIIDEEIEKVEISDLHGNVVNASAFDPATGQILTNELSRGIYFCKVIKKNQTSLTSRLVVRH